LPFNWHCRLPKKFKPEALKCFGVYLRKTYVRVYGVRLSECE
jgi:hypothetical protein